MIGAGKSVPSSRKNRRKGDATLARPGKRAWRLCCDCRPRQWPRPPQAFGPDRPACCPEQRRTGQAAFPGFHLAQGFIAGNKHFVLHSRGNGHACGLGQADEDRAAAPPDVRAVYGRGLVHGAAVEGEREFRLRAKICDRAFAGRIGHHIPEVIETQSALRGWSRQRMLTRGLLPARVAYA